MINIKDILPLLFLIPSSIVLNIINRQIIHFSLITRQTWNREYDYIVIGAGSAGSVMAARLSEDPNIMVLLIEAGSSENIISDIPTVSTEVLLLTPMNWAFETVRQKRSCFGLVNRKSLWSRGKSMGGSSSINTMNYVRGNRHDYDQWASDGANGWSWREIFPYFIISEHNHNRDYASSGYHGLNGPLSISSQTLRTEIGNVFEESAQYLGYETGDFNGPVQSTFAIQQLHAKNGERFSVSRAYLEPIRDRDNLHILAFSYVTKILFNDEKRAIGVEFDRLLIRNTVYTRNEIILSAGTINSPKILLLSGIGPKNQLSRFGIPMIADLPVGNNLQDHVGSQIFFTVNKSVSIIRKQFSPPEYLKYFATHNNSLANGIVQGISFIKTKYAEQFNDWPDIELLLYAGSYADDPILGLYTQGFNGLNATLWSKVFGPYTDSHTIMLNPNILRPKSRGWIRLKSIDPNDPPLINPKYFSDPNDVDIKTLVEGMKLSLMIGQTPPFQRFNATPFINKVPKCDKFPIYSDNHLKCIARTITLTFYHPIGTCKMGSENDSTAVVDTHLRVKGGVKGLRVVDSSIMPKIISGNTNSITVVIAEKAADYIKGRRLKPFDGPLSSAMISSLPILPYELLHENK